MADLAPGWTILSAYVLKSPEGKLVNYTRYREITGCCEECGVRMDEHSRCEACAALAGRGHSVSCSSYRGHDICGYCLSVWERLDTILQRKATWVEFLDPTQHTAEILTSRKATLREVDSVTLS